MVVSIILSFIILLEFASISERHPFFGHRVHQFFKGPYAKCTFDQPGPLDPQDLNCYANILPYASPVSFTEVAAPAIHNMRGISNHPTQAPVPIFIQFKDRVSFLIEEIRAFHRHLATPFEIIIVDDSSTYPPAVNFLARLREANVTVLTVPDHATEQFNDIYSVVANMITQHTKGHASPVFVWTDPDVPLDSAPGDLLDVYAHVLDALNLYNVGASIRWDDWVEPLRDNKLLFEAPFLQLPAKCHVYRSVCYYYLEAPLDTTFAMYKTGTPLSRLREPSIRMLPPLGIRHLDAMIEADAVPDDVRYYAKATSDEISHSWFRGAVKAGEKQEGKDKAAEKEEGVTSGEKLGLLPTSEGSDHSQPT
ncbi:hypothetical protein HKX48_001062 [Thoreauomyces humboldtii]|nr:hypothetical protein HKX48_001062 [Thoreauomyces humboldtii]